MPQPTGHPRIVKVVALGTDLLQPDLGPADPARDDIEHCERTICLKLDCGLFVM
jgi:hypothetical protein